MARATRRRPACRPGQPGRRYIVPFLVVPCSQPIDYLIDRGAFLLHFRQSWSSHFATAKSFEYGSANDHPFDWSIFLKNWDPTVPALVGIGLLLRAKLPALYSRDRMSLVSPSLRLSPPPSAGERVAGQPATGPSGSVGKTVVAMVPFAWLTLTSIVFATHKPWWSYYYIHIAVPLCWCAAIGVEVGELTNYQDRFGAMVRLPLCQGAGEESDRNGGHAQLRLLHVKN